MQSVLIGISSMLNKLSKAAIQNLVRQHTKLCRSHLTPELQLHLITPECPLWRSHPSHCPFTDPFWAFYWPGGQALTRFILDNPKLFKDKKVLDIGSGCGSAALASAIVGAKSVVANDIDEVSLVAIEMNMDANSTTVTVDGFNYLANPSRQKFDVVLFGDMFYDPDFAALIDSWLKATQVSQTSVFVGDPGRLPFKDHPIRLSMRLLEEYTLSETSVMENSGFSCAAVWTLMSYTFNR